MKITLYFADGTTATIKTEADKKEYYLELARFIANKDKNNPASVSYLNV